MKVFGCTVTESTLGVSAHEPDTVMCVLAKTLPSCTLRTVTTYVPAVVAVNLPVELMLPPDEAQVTSCE